MQQDGSNPLEGRTHKDVFNAYLRSFHGARDKSLTAEKQGAYTTALSQLGPFVEERAAFHPSMEVRAAYSDLIQRTYAQLDYDKSTANYASDELANIGRRTAPNRRPTRPFQSDGDPDTEYHGPEVPERGLVRDTLPKVPSLYPGMAAERRAPKLKSLDTITYDADDLSGLYVPQSIGDLDATLDSEEMEVRRQIFSGEMGPDREVETEALGKIKIPDYSYLREEVRDVLMGKRAGSGLIGTTLAGAPTTSGVQNLVEKFDAGFASMTGQGPGSDTMQDVPTALPGGPIAYSLPLVKDRYGRNDHAASAKLLQDPVHARGIQEVIDDLVETGELTPTVAESFWATTGFLADFAVTDAVAGPALGLVGKVAGKGMSKIGKNWLGKRMSTAWEAARAGKHKFSVPMLSGTIREPIIFARYEATAALVNGEDITEGAYAGAKSGLELMGMGAVAKVLRRQTGSAYLRAHKIAGALTGGRLSLPGAPTLERFRRAAVRQGHTQEIVDKVVAGLPSSKKPVMDQLRKHYGEGEKAQWIAKAIDAETIGLSFAAWHEARTLAADEWDSIGGMAKAELFFSALDNPTVIAASIPFVLSTGVHQQISKRGMSKEKVEEREGKEETLEMLAAHLAHQSITDPENLRQALDRMAMHDVMLKDRPDLLPHDSPEAALRARERLGQRIRKLAAKDTAKEGAEVKEGEAPVTVEGEAPAKATVPRGTVYTGRPAPKHHEMFDVAGDPMVDARGDIQPPRGLPEGQLKNLRWWAVPPKLAEVPREVRRKLQLEPWQARVDELVGEVNTPEASMYAAKIIRSANDAGLLRESFGRGEMTAERTADILSSAGVETPSWLWKHVDPARLTTREQTPKEREATADAHRTDPDKLTMTDPEVVDQVQRERVESKAKPKNIGQLERGLTSFGTAEESLAELRTIKGNRLRPWLLRKTAGKLRKVAERLGIKTTADWSKSELAHSIEMHGTETPTPVRIDQARALTKRMGEIRRDQRKVRRLIEKHGIKEHKEELERLNEELRASYKEASEQFGSLTALEDAATDGRKRRSKSSDDRRKAALSGELGFVPMIQALGGMEHSNDIPGVIHNEVRYPGFSKFMRRKGKGGMTFDEAVEAAQSAGLLEAHGEVGGVEKVGHREMLDLISSEVSREKSERGFEEEQARENQEVLDQAQDFLDKGGDPAVLPEVIQIELGIEMPKGPRPTAPENKDESRAHKELVEPPHALFSPEKLMALPEGSAAAEMLTWAREVGVEAKTRLAQAGVKLRSIAESLQSAGLIPEGAELSHPGVVETLLNIGAGSPGPRLLYGRKMEGTGLTAEQLTADYNEMRRSVNDFLAYTLAAHISVHEGVPESAATMGAWVQGMESLHRHGKLTLEAREALEKAKLLDEFGGPDYRALLVFEQAMNIHLSKEGKDPNIEELHSGVNPLSGLIPAVKKLGETLDKVPGVSWLGTRYLWDSSRSQWPFFERLSMRYLVDKHAVGESTKLSEFNQWLTLKTGRMDHAGGLPSMVAKNVQRMLELVINPRQRLVQDLQTKVAILSGDLVGPWGRGGPPAEMKARLVKLHDAGKFSSGEIDSPEALEKILGPGSKHLYEYAHDYSALWSDVMSESVAVGAMNTDQAAKMEGHFSPHFNLEVSMREIESQIAEGNASWLLPGRDMRRSKGSELTVLDPDFLSHVGVAQESRMIEFMGTVHDVISKGLSWRPEEVADLSPREKGWLQTFALPENVKRDPLTNRKGKPEQYAMGHIVEGWRRGMESKENWSKGKYSKEKHPYTEAKAKMIEELMPTDPATKKWKPGRVLQIQNARSVEDLREGTFFKGYHPDINPTLAAFIGDFGAGVVEASRENHIGEFLSQKVDEVSRVWRRNMTVLRAQHWWLNETSSVFLNYTSGGATPVDYARGILTGKGNYADAWRGIIAWEKVVKAGRPDIRTVTGRAKLKELGLLEVMENGEFTRVEAIVEALGGGTFHSTLIGGGIIGEVLEPMLDRDAIERAVMQDRSARGLQQELLWKDVDQVSQTTTRTIGIAAAVQGRTLGPSQAAFDRKLIEGMGSDNVGDNVAALAKQGSSYQLNELAFKLANSLAFYRARPGLSWRAAMEMGSRGTVNFSKTSSLAKNLTTRFNLLSASQTATSGGGVMGVPHTAAKVGAKFAMQGPFWLFRIGSIPHQARAALRNPLRTLAVGAGIGVTMTAADMAFDGDGAGNSFDEAISGTSYGQAHEGANAKLWEAAERLHVSDMSMMPPGMQGGKDLSPSLRYAMARWWHKAAQHYSMMGRAPSRGGAERLFDLTEFAWPAGPIEAQLRGAENREKTSYKESARALVDSLSGLMPTAAKGMIAYGMSLGTPSKKTWSEKSMKFLMAFMKNAASDFHPTTGAFGPRATRAFEQTQTGGVPVHKWFVGMTNRLDAQVTPGHKIIDFALSGILPTRQMPSWIDDTTSDESMLRGVMRNILPKWDAPRGSAEELNQLQSVRLVRDWLSHYVGSAYLHFKQNPGEGSFDKLLQNDLDVSRDVSVSPHGVYSMRDDPETEVGKFLKQYLGSRPEMLEVAARYIGAEDGAFQNRVAPALMHAARTRQMDVATFQQIFRSTLVDPGGSKAIDLAYQALHDKGDHERAPDFFFVLSFLSPPPQNTNRLTSERWRWLQKYYVDRVDSAELDLGSVKGMTMEKALGSDKFNAGAPITQRALNERPFPFRIPSDRPVTPAPREDFLPKNQ